MKLAVFKLFSLVATAFFFLITVGCDSGGLGTVPAKGTLTIDGEPANNVTVTLVPVDGGREGQEAAGQVQNGEFELYTGIKGEPGAVPGKYKVVLSAMGGAGEDAQYQTSGRGARGRGGGSPEQTPELPFPEKYTTPATSDKEVEITPGKNDLTIEITSE